MEFNKRTTDPKHTIVLISCVSKKAVSAKQAKDLYISPLFKKCWTWTCDVLKKHTPVHGIYILSAGLNLVRYDQVIKPYDKTLINMTKTERLEWADKIKEQLTEIFCKNGLSLDDFNFVILAGSKYYENILDVIPNYELPLGALPVGKRLGVLTKAISNKKLISAGEIIN